MARRSTKRLLALDECAVAGARYGTERAIRGVARAQHGAVARAQLAALGLSASAIDTRVNRGRFATIHRGVYLVGPLGGERLDEAAAILACPPGTYVSHRSALHLLGVGTESVKPGRVEVTTTQRRVRRARIRAHHSADLLDRETTTREGIPVTTPERALIDCAPRLDPSALEHALAEAYAAKLTNRRRLLATVGRHRGRPGVTSLVALLEASDGPARTRSRPERELLALLRSAGLTPVRTNVRLGRWEVDFCFPESKLVVEVDALSTHTAPRAFERDRRKDAELVLAGFTVIRVTRRQIEHEPHAVIARIAAARALCK